MKMSNVEVCSTTNRLLNSLIMEIPVEIENSILKRIKLKKLSIIPFNDIYELSLTGADFERVEDEFQWAVIESDLYENIERNEQGLIPLNIGETDVYYFDDLNEALVYAYSEELRHNFIGQ